MYSLNLRSSACARRESCSNRFSGKRSFNSSVHFSAINHPEKNPARAPGPAGLKRSAFDGSEGDTCSCGNRLTGTARRRICGSDSSVISSSSTSSQRTSIDPSFRMNSVISGGLFFYGTGKHIRPQQLQVHQARLRYPCGSPARNRARLDATKPCYFVGPA
jgi:hypothetical protein